MIGNRLIREFQFVEAYHVHRLSVHFNLKNSWALGTVLQFSARFARLASRPRGASAVFRGVRMSFFHPAGCA